VTVLIGLLVVALFQIALAAGMPWGAYAMGGAYPGVYPLPMRVAALAQLLIYAATAAIILARAGWAIPRLVAASRMLIWVIVAFFALAIVLNLTSQSIPERLLWTPFAVAMFLASLRIALAQRPLQSAK
jgi:hypothetical protein